MHICMIRVYIHGSVHDIARAFISPWTTMAYKLPNFLAKEGRGRKKNNEKRRKKKGERWIERNRKKGKQEKGRGTCCADRTSCEHVRNTFDEFIRNEIQDVSRHVLLDG